MKLVVDGILLLNEETILKLKMEHPQAVNPDPEVLFPDYDLKICPVQFKSVTTKAAQRAAIRTKGGHDTVGIDADVWQKILTSTSYGQGASNVCKTMARFIRKLCPKNLDSATFEALLSCRFISLDENRGVDEILNRIAGKFLVATTRIYVITNTGFLQV